MMDEKEEAVNNIVIGPWQRLEGGFGVKLAVQDRFTAAATPDQLFSWIGDRLTHDVRPAFPQYGYPRWGNQMLFWGNGKLEMFDKQYIEFPATRSSIVAGTGASEIPSPKGLYQSAFFAWAADGKALVATASWVGGTSNYPARALLLNERGESLAILWESIDLAPEAAWVGTNWIVLGTRSPLVFDRQGNLLGTLESGGPALRMEVSEKEDRLLLVESGRIAVWDTESWEKIGDLPGDWLDAAISPSGNTVVALDFQGALHLMKLHKGISLEKILISSPPILAVALGKDRIVAAFSDDNVVCTASFRETF